jgi:hypothetical protein
MYHILFEENSTYEVAVLIKLTSLRKASLAKHYVDPLIAKGIPSNQFIGFSLKPDAKTAKPQREYLETLLPAIDSLGVKYLLVNDTPYFKVLTGVKDASCTYGAAYPCVIKGYEHLKILHGS